jgi:peptidoglycan/LPS O-acetylase OafA/YrhL
LPGGICLNKQPGDPFNDLMSVSAFAVPVAAPRPVASQPPQKKSSYQPQLDGLRGIAIISVVLHHFDVHLPGLFDWGPIGVRIFFLLSGYLITQSLWRLQADSERAGGGYWPGLLGFHARRMARLLPVLYLMIAAACLMGLPEFRHAVGWHAAFLSNFYALRTGDWPAGASHLWSLSVQEQFYLLWPFLILVTPRKWLPPVLLALVVGGFLFRAMIIGVGASDFYRWVMLPGVIDTFALGALIACLRKSGQPLPLTSGWIGAGVGVLAIGCFVLARFVRFGPFLGVWAAVIETLENLFFAWMLLRTVAGWRGLAGAVFENPGLIFIGKISYGLYIFHVLVNVALTPWLERHGFGVHENLAVRTVVLFGVSVGVASLSYYFLEAPLGAWVRRKEMSLPGAQAQPA